MGSIPWGTHLCQFYETKQDLIDILVPYFAEGLKNNEFCMWVTSSPLEVEEAKLALQKAVPNLDEYVKKGQIEVISYDKWYLRDGKFDSNRITNGWVEKENAALAHGFDGLRLTGNTFWVEQELWKSFVDYEEVINNVIRNHRILALCTYCLKKCSGTDVLDVVRNHIGTLIKQNEKWSLVEDNIRRKKADAEIARLASFPAMNPNPVIEVDIKGNLKYANSSALTTFPNIQEHPLQHPFFSGWEEILKSVRAEKGGTFSREQKVGDHWYYQQFYFVPQSQSIRSYTIQVDSVKQAEKMLRESEERWATTVSSIGDAVIATDLKGNITFLNNVAERLTGWQMQDAQQKPLKQVFNIINEVTRKEVDSPVDRVIREGLIVGLANHTLLVQKDGTEVPIDDSGAPIKDKMGNITGVVLVFRDITERKKAEEKLQQTSGYLENLLNYANAPIIVWDQKFKITLFNNAFERLTGLSTKDVIEKPLEILFPEDKKEEAMAHIKRALEGEYWEAVEIPIKDVEGNVRTVLWNSANIYDSTGKEVISTIAQGHDITERKQAEQALQRAKVDWERTFNSVPDLIAILDNHHKIVRANRAMAEALGTTPEKCIGLKCFRCLHRTEEPPEFCPHSKALLDGKEHTAEVHEATLGGDFIVSASPLKDAQGRMVGSVHVARNITVHKQMENKLEEYSKHLENLVAERTKQLRDSERLATIGATAGMVGHDIRNPLQAITCDLYLAVTEVESCPKGKCKTSVKESLLEIEKNIDYINKIVADLQDFARPLKPNVSENNLEPIIDEALNKYSVPENIIVKKHIAKDAQTVMADSSYIKRILSNLINNAVQAMPSGGTLVIEAYSEKKDVTLTITDTGVGIAEETKEKLFTPLFTTKSKGQGFGLAVVKRMAEALGGTVTFESQTGKGTKFIVRLPKRKSSQQPKSLT